ncbi:MAG: cytochrome ubiquinol oxidase subunit I [Candidatus Limnocylindrales bacterium]|jgi:cytochrome d ubiquinol oxidase subunit I
MSALDLARWQFGITTVYHFLFVPLTISLAFIVAGFQTAWLRGGNEKYLRLTRFFGELFLINFAMGVATGIVQEFQFGMNWSDYSRFVGDIFGAPLAIEGLLAFFLESTFLGIWIFGWDRLPRKVHLATIWIVAVGTVISAYVILAANSWMQHPVGYAINQTTGRAELKDFFAVLFNPTVLMAFPHVIAGAFMTGGAFVLGVAVWRLLRHRTQEEESPFRTAAKVGASVLLVAGLVVVISGDQLGKSIAVDQPMKLAAAEGLYQTEQPASFSVFTLWDLNGNEIVSLKIPNLLSFLATGDINGKVSGIDDLQAQDVALYGAGDYSPIVPVTFWSFRLMIGVGSLAALAALWFLWRLRKGGLPGKGGVAIAVVLPLLPLAANSFAWIFTEMGRQPWIVYGLQLTSNAVSPDVSSWEVAATLVGFTLLYGGLAVVEVGLLLKRIRAGLPAVAASDEAADRPIAFGY